MLHGIDDLSKDWFGGTVMRGFEKMFWYSVELEGYVVLNVSGIFYNICFFLLYKNTPMGKHIVSLSMW